MTTDKNEYELEYFKSHLASVLQSQQAVTDFEHAMMKPAYYLNGGAVVVYTTVLGASAAVPPDPYQPIIVWSLGLLAAFFATYFGHESQAKFYDDGRHSALANCYEYTDMGDEAEETLKLAKELTELGEKQKKRWQALLFVSVLMFVLGAFSAVDTIGL